jgi:hypothetical protein
MIVLRWLTPGDGERTTIATTTVWLVGVIEDGGMGSPGVAHLEFAGGEAPGHMDVMPVKEDRATWNAHLLLSALLLTLLLASVPVRNIQYALPWVVAIHLALAGRSLLLARLIALSLVAMALSFSAGLLSLDVMNASGVVWGAVTYATLLFWIAWPRSQVLPVDHGLVRRRGADLVAAFMTVQSTVGIAQYALSRNPDSVTGTLDPLAYRSGASTIVQPSFAVVLVGALLFLAAMRTRRFHAVALMLGAVCLLLSQAGHQVIMLVGAAVAIALVAELRVGTLVRIGVSVCALVLGIQVLSPATARLAPVWFERTVLSDDSLKRQVWEDSLALVNDGASPFAGYGAGQFSSRAGLISSGDYLSIPLPPSVTGKSSLFVELVEPQLETYDRVGEGSAIAKPYSSVTSVLVEFGPMLALILGGLGAHAVVSSVRRARRAEDAERRIRLGMATGITFLAGISLVENYLELAQAVFLPGLLYFVAKAVADSCRSTAPVAAECRSYSDAPWG